TGAAFCRSVALRHHVGPGRSAWSFGGGGRRMRISRHEKEAERLEYEEWPVLVDIPIAAVEYPSWEGRYRSSEGPWTFEMEVDGVPATEPPNFRYHVELGEEDVAEILKGLPVQAVRTVLD